MKCLAATIVLTCTVAAAGCASAPPVRQQPSRASVSRAVQLDRLRVADANASAPDAAPVDYRLDPETRDLALKVLAYPLLLRRHARSGHALPLDGTPAVKLD